MPGPRWSTSRTSPSGIGTSFAVSDVEVTSQRTRYVVMGHSVVGFFYNTLVIAVVVGVLTQG
jgi:uncharacterized membrane protein